MRPPRREGAELTGQQTLTERIIDCTKQIERLEAELCGLCDAGADTYRNPYEDVRRKHAYEQAYEDGQVLKKIAR